MSPVIVTALWVLPLLVAWLWRPRQAASPGAWILLVAFGALGAWALWFGLYAHSGEPADFAFWKPTVLYWTLAAIMIVAPLLGWGYPVKIILGTYFALSNREWRWINRGFATVYAILRRRQPVGGLGGLLQGLGRLQVQLHDEPAHHRPVPLELRLAAHPRGCVHPPVSPRHRGLSVSVEPVLSVGSTAMRGCPVWVPSQID